jgi:hypothetical protein
LEAATKRAFDQVLHWTALHRLMGVIADKARDLRDRLTEGSR